MPIKRGASWVIWGAAILLAVGAGLGGRLVLEDRSGNGALMAADLGGPFDLIDHTGARITEADLEGSPSALFFGFTHCPEICPTTVYDMDLWLDELGPAGEEIKVFFVTIDPERDTPEVLGGYLTAMSDRVIGISGPPDDVRAMADVWRVYYNRQPLDDGDYTMDHTSLVYLLDDNGDYVDLIRYNEAMDSAVEKLSALLTN